MAGKVLDKASLRAMFTKLFSLLGLLIPVIVALGPSAIAATRGACDLSSEQVAAIRAIVATGSNSSQCSYNASLNDIIGR